MLANLSRPMGLTAVLVLGTSLVASGADLTHNELRGTHLSERWKQGEGVVTSGGDGKVIFLFGEIQPSVVCSPLQVCDIELQAGEIVRDVMIGDTVRWKVEPATSGSSDQQTVHLVVKPAEPGLKTSMVVTTSRRTYHIQLKSHPNQYMARVGFDYPEDVNARFAENSARVEASIIPGAGIPAEQLDFAYRVTGSSRWKPVRVYSDRQKTYIQFPTSLAGQHAPVLFIVSGGENHIVNYRIKGTMMIVDYDIEEALLVSGTGRRQQKITIRRGT